MQSPAVPLVSKPSCALSWCFCTAGHVHGSLDDVVVHVRQVNRVRLASHLPVLHLRSTEDRSAVLSRLQQTFLRVWPVFLYRIMVPLVDGVIYVGQACYRCLALHRCTLRREKRPATQHTVSALAYPKPEARPLEFHSYNSDELPPYARHMGHEK